MAPYINFTNKCEEAFDLYRYVFGGEFEAMIRFKDMPMGDQPIPDHVADLIMHISLPIGSGHMLMGSDAPEGFAPRLTPGNSISVSINTDSKEEADRLFNGLSAGGKVNMPMDNAPWGSYFGMLTDPFGIDWMVSFPLTEQKIQ
ncbi:MAG: VOC family protein [Bacteroidota bacterium]|nr:VOC family protein [Bacteroidota bacterium]